MKIALVKNNKIENIIIADLDFAKTLKADEVFKVTTENIGDEKINGIWTNPITLALSNRTVEEILSDKTTEEKEWRDSELQASDFIAPLTDHPQHAAYMTYRQELRDYPLQSDFPNGQRPVKP